MSDDRKAIASGAKRVEKMMSGLFEAASAGDKFLEFEDALKEKGYGCASKEELAKHRELFVDWMRSGGTISDGLQATGGMHGTRIYESAYGAKIAMAKMNSRCKPTPLSDARDKFNQSKATSSPIILASVACMKCGVNLTFNHHISP